MLRASSARTNPARADRTTAEADAVVRVGEIKQRLKTLEARDAELVEAQIRIERERAEVAAAIELTEAKLEAAVAAPVAGGVDPTLWLPDELMVLILVQVAFLNDCTAVCRRWRRLCQDRTVKNRSWETRWELYAAGKQLPKIVPKRDVVALCPGGRAGVNGIVYCGEQNGNIEVRSDTDGSLLQTLNGHTTWAISLAVGSDGTLYSGSTDSTLHVWSAETGARVQALQGHTHGVLALAVNEAYLFSGSVDETIQVWQRSTGILVRTLDTDDLIFSLALGTHDQLYAGENGGSIEVWSTTDYGMLRTLHGHSGRVFSMTVAKDGTLFSAGDDAIIRVWSGADGALLRTLEGHTDAIMSLAIAPTGTLLSASIDSTLRVWRSEGCSPLVVAVPGGTRMILTNHGNVWVLTSLSLILY